MKKLFQKTMSLCLAVTLLVSSAMVSHAAPVAPNSPVVVSVTAARSTFLDGAKPDTTNATHQNMIVKYTQNPKYRRDGIIGFDLQALDESKISQAILKLYIAKADVKQGVTEVPAVHVFGFGGDWKAEDLTWNAQPTYMDETDLGSAPVFKDEWSRIDITDYLKKNLANAKLSFRLEGDKQTEVYLNVAGAKAANQPTIEITLKDQTGPISGDTQKDLTDSEMENIERKQFMEQNDKLLGTFYVDKSAPTIQRAKTDTLLIGKDFSSYFVAKEISKVDNPHSAYLRFFVKEDYKSPVMLEIWGLKNAEAVDENVSFDNPAQVEDEPVYEMAITNQGWYTVDVTEYVKRKDAYGFYLKTTGDDAPIIKVASYHSEKNPVLYIAEQEDEFDAIRHRFSMKKGNYDVNDPQIKAMLTKIDERADGFIQKINRAAARTKVFDDYPLDWDEIKQQKYAGKPEPEATYLAAKLAADNMRNSYVRLSTLLRAYNTKGSAYEDSATLYKDIKDGMADLFNLQYNPHMTENGNWWQWEIGTPKVLGEMLVTMYSDLTPKERMDYIGAMYRFQPNPEMSYYNRNSINPKEALPPQISVGANRVDTVIGGLYIGIAAKNPDLMKHAVDALHDVYQYVEKADGFYRDGSFIQHKNIAYTTGYGMVLISGLADLDYKLDGSRWQITDPDYDNVYDWLENSFVPVVFDGQAFPVVAGRSLSRQHLKTELGGSFADGYKVARMLYQAAQGAPQEKKDKFLSIARRFMEKNSFYDVKENATNTGMLAEYEKLQQVEMADAYIGSHVFANMDRVIHHRENYALALAMHSARIQNFEMMNGENLKGWNQGNGTLYLLNGDAGQYDNGFWPTVDSYRLAGTTVVNVARTTNDHQEEYVSTADFVGGTDLDNRYSIGVMDMGHPDKTKNKNLKYNPTLTAKKSWFFFDDEVIALGAGIHSSDDAEVETIIENRMIREDAANQVFVEDALKLPNVSAVTEDFAQIKWAYLEGNEDKSLSSIGYYFPDTASVWAVKQNRTGSWNEINTKGSKDVISRNYFKMGISHGKNPKDATYSYALIPSKTKEEVKAYAENPQYEVLKNTTKAQAVQEKTLGIYAANVFDETEGDFDKFTVNKPSSVMVQEKDNRISVSVADPTMKLKEKLVLTLKVDLSGGKELVISDKSSNVEVIAKNPLQLQVDLSGAKGKPATLHARIKTPEVLLPYTPQTGSSQTGEEIVLPKEKEENVPLSDANLAAKVEAATKGTDAEKHWARQEMGELMVLNILKGYPNGNLMPQESVTRAQMAQILSNILDYKKLDTDFHMTSESKAWYQAAVERVQRLKLMLGDKENNFHPHRVITREEVFTVLGRFGKWDLSMAQANEVLAVFSDSEEISEYARPYLAKMVQKGFIKGDGDKLNPRQSITRAELSVVIQRMLKGLKDEQ